MIILVRFIGIFVICAGVVLLVSPESMRKMLTFWKQDKRIYVGVFLRILTGMIFILAAPQARFPRVIVSLGGVIVAMGILIFIIGLERAKGILSWWEKKTGSFLRLAAILILAIGALIYLCA